MSNPIMKIDNLSKRYRIGATQRGYKTFREAIVEGITAPFNNFKKLRRMTEFKNDIEKDVIWALKDVSFEVNEGEVLGIIGGNGAGKSTLLKIMSRIAEPTSGSVEVRGRISSLLEIGTGFHPELTGRENIFLNGVTMGMRKREIEKRFDEIVAFSEIGEFLDTQVKRYSSGMYVRLAFAVAAYLEPEILLVDEVLAVGDVQFQKKCLNKMGDVAKGGRTVLFVSHNMAAVQQLCSRTIRLQKGCVVDDAPTREAISNYLSMESTVDKGDMDLSDPKLRRNSLVKSEFRWTKITIINSEGKPTGLIKFGEPFEIILSGIASAAIADVRVGFSIDSSLGVAVFNSFQIDHDLPGNLPQGAMRFRVSMEPNLLAPGYYQIGIGAIGKGIVDWIPETLQFRISDTGAEEQKPWHSYDGGLVRYPCNWQLEQIKDELSK
jgi:lipopolysaccharide transport system ATP-binding protein